MVTGGATGIGAGLVEAFAAQGARVAFIDIDEAGGAATAARFAPGAFHACDLRDIDALQGVIGRIGDELGGIDVLVNNAANDDRHSIEAVTPAYWDDRMATNLRHLFFAAQAVVPAMRVNNAANDDRHSIEAVTPAYWDDRMATNLRHLFFAAQAVVPAMRAAGGGAIINFGSISWHLGLPDLVVYQTAKAAIEGMTRALARDLGGHNIRVTTIVPGNVETPRQALWHTPADAAEIVAAQCVDGRIQPADVAAMALFLASDDARMCTGHEYFVDAGWR
ncbi:SDR family oxidoreductase [Polymorphobacter fuscus]|uniref:SDR family oxidoreductase n=1 Tax=Sandarakinorhabdus fusca TaxID=1439888 RepID=A0A7C9GT96_9SPHN|nr:SDR family oxidoreductase [Polymorphobacter fuscus]KAB7644164.1 SDR family oxidoreductase [Polymorphobacter fuscus]MQT18451.1 SDR family oxidoreductase [Polymorphobacter fuscus]